MKIIEVSGLSPWEQAALTEKRRKELLEKERTRPLKFNAWETPPDLFNPLNDEFHFNLEACANDENHKLPLYFTEKTNGLLQEWSPRTCWVAAPYDNPTPWVRKAYEETLKGATVVCLLREDSSTNWFQNWVFNKASEIRLLKKRPRFLYKNTEKGTPPTSSILAIYRGKVTESKWVYQD